MSNVLNMVSEETFVDQTDDIVSAINAIGGGGEEGFDLLPSGTVTATDGAFSVLYKGTAPAVNTAKIILVNKPYGIHDDVEFGVSFVNGEARFNARRGHYAGYMTVNAEAVVVFGDYAKKMTILNLPVNYGYGYTDTFDKSAEPVELRKSGDDWVGTLDEFPKNVSPAFHLEYGALCLLFNETDEAVHAYCGIENGVITISNMPEVEFLEAFVYLALPDYKIVLPIYFMEGE